MNKYTILAGVTHDNELYFIDIEKKHEQHNYFSISGYTVIPTELELAKSISRESIYDYVENAISDINTLFVRDIDDIVDDMIDSDGNLSGIDTSLYEGDVEVGGETYVFQSSSCGQHKEKELKKYFIKEQEYRDILDAWDKYHLKDIELNTALVSMKMYSLEYVLDNIEKQNIPALLAQGITFINNQ